jgi:hypothetical protein
MSQGQDIERRLQSAAMESAGRMPGPSPGDAAPPSGGHHYPLTFSVVPQEVLALHNRVAAYAFLLITDRYPPFSLQP